MIILDFNKIPSKEMRKERCSEHKIWQPHFGHLVKVGLHRGMTTQKEHQSSQQAPLHPLPLQGGEPGSGPSPAEGCPERTEVRGRQTQGKLTTPQSAYFKQHRKDFLGELLHFINPPAGFPHPKFP